MRLFSPPRKSSTASCLVSLFLPLLFLGAAPLSRGQSASPWPFPPLKQPTPAASTGAPAPGAAQPAQAAPASGTPGSAKLGLSAPKAFVHPGLYYSASDLAFMRQKLAAKAEPWHGAWEQDKPNAKEDAWVAHPVADWDANKDFYMGGDPLVAHKQALQWALTGNPANAAKAIEILNAWSSTLRTIPVHQMPQEKLASGINGFHFANTAELLCYGAAPGGKASGWSAADIAQFKKMLGLIYGTIESFYPGFNGNWDGMMMNSMISMGVFLDDKAMFERAVKHYAEGQSPNGGLVNYIYPSGQCQESARDQGHVQWGLGSFVAVCEVAWKQGLDLYGLENNRLMVGLEYTAKYMLGNTVPFEQRGKGPISDKGRGSFATIWEAPYQHYVVRRGLEMPFTKQIIFGTSIKKGGKAPPGIYRPEGDYHAGISWGTFTMFKGAEDPQAARKP